MFLSQASSSFLVAALVLLVAALVAFLSKYYIAAGDPITSLLVPQQLHLLEIFTNCPKRKGF
jgi:hypothetical protein